MLKPWMVEIRDIINEDANEQAVHWYWEPVGDVGQSKFFKNIYVINITQYISMKLIKQI